MNDAANSVFAEALALVSGDGEIEIAREGSLAVGVLSISEMLRIVASVPDAPQLIA
jgi:hypothetical protein